MNYRFKYIEGAFKLNRLGRLLVLAASVAVAQGLAIAQSVEPIKYTLRFPAPHTHYVEVEAAMPTGGKPQIEVMMPVWTPGSYLVREFSRNVENVSARTTDRKQLAVEKSQKNRWRVQTGGAPTVVLSYRVYSREMSVRTNFIDSSFALLNGAPTFITLVENTRRPHEVKIVLPSDWKTTMTGLPAAPGGGPHHYLANDYDTLADSPIIAGNPSVYEFEVDGKKHYLVNVGEAGVWDGPRSAQDVEKIVRENRKMWGFLPYDKYVFINLLTEAGGGLEHKNSTVLLTSRWATRTRKGYIGDFASARPDSGWLPLVSHEFFHAWNVKRLRPIELGPFDYENEVYTRSLWEAEGLTNYYGDLLLRRAGLMTREEYLGSLSVGIEALQTTPGRLVQPVEMASFDAWIKYYRPDENSSNTAISYYTKGAVIGFLLDAKIRRATNGRKSLDDVMRLAYQRFAGERGFTPQEFRMTAQEVAGIDLRDWFIRTLETTEELDYSEALGWFGLRFKEPADKAEPRAWLGLVTRAENGRLMVTQVRRGTPGYDAGFNVEDEILAIGDFRVEPAEWATSMDRYKPGDKVSVLVSRRDQLMRLDVTFGQEPPRSWRLEVRPDAIQEQKARLKAFLGE